jgi:hypothetical protein
MPMHRRDPDDDVLSMSARSVASSCSLASDTYERAKRRTEEFWGKKMLNFCGIVLVILKMETGRNFSMSGINSGR